MTQETLIEDQEGWLCAAFNGWLVLRMVLYTTTKSGWETD